METPKAVCAFCGEGVNCEHGKCNACDSCRKCKARANPVKISESDFRGVFGHKCDQPTCPVCNEQGR